MPSCWAIWRLLVPILASRRTSPCELLHPPAQGLLGNASRCAREGHAIAFVGDEPHGISLELLAEPPPRRDRRRDGIVARGCSDMRGTAESWLPVMVKLLRRA